MVCLTRTLSKPASDTTKELTTEPIGNKSLHVSKVSEKNANGSFDRKRRTDS